MAAPSAPAAPPGSAASRDNPLLGIFCKLAAHLLFALMFAAVKWLGPEFPTGQIVFWRSAIGILVIVAMALATGGPSLLMTRRIDAHAFRSLSGVASMFCNFAAFTLLPLADATTLGFAQPLFVVALAAVILGEHVRIYRWSAVLTGLLGVLIIVGPYIEFGGSHLMGAALALAGAALSAVAMIYLRRMSAHEHSVTIAFYFMATTSVIGLCTALFGWVTPTPQQMLVLLMTGLFGGAGQLFLSFSYRYLEASALAPFDYTALIWATALGYFVFGELPMLQVWLGAAIIVAAGLFILWREHRLGKARALQVEAA